MTIEDKDKLIKELVDKVNDALYDSPDAEFSKSCDFNYSISCWYSYDKPIYYIEHVGYATGEFNNKLDTLSEAQDYLIAKLKELLNEHKEQSEEK